MNDLSSFMVTVVLEITNCAQFLANFAVDLDELQNSGTTLWFVKAHAKSVSHDSYRPNFFRPGVMTDMPELYSMIPV